MLFVPGRDGQAALKGGRGDQHIDRELGICIDKIAPPRGDFGIDGHKTFRVVGSETIEPRL